MAARSEWARGALSRVSFLPSWGRSAGNATPTALRRALGATSSWCFVSFLCHVLSLALRTRRSSQGMADSWRVCAPPAGESLSFVSSSVLGQRPSQVRGAGGPGLERGAALKETLTSQACLGSTRGIVLQCTGGQCSPFPPVPSRVVRPRPAPPGLSASHLRGHITPAILLSGLTVPIIPLGSALHYR